MIAYQVTYSLADGDVDLVVPADFTLEQASQMVLRLFSGTWGTLGDVVSVQIVPTDRVIDTRSLEEIERNVIA